MNKSYIPELGVEIKMKSRSKVGNKPSNPAYRTQATFRYRKHVATARIKTSPKKRG